MAASTSLAFASTSAPKARSLVHELEMTSRRRNVESGQADLPWGGGQKTDGETNDVESCWSARGRERQLGLCGCQHKY